MNVSFLALLTEFALHILLYINTVKRSRRRMCSESSLRQVGSCVIAMKDSVTLGKLAHAFQAVFLPIPNIANITSQPVHA